MYSIYSKTGKYFPEVDHPAPPADSPWEPNSAKFPSLFRRGYLPQWPELYGVVDSRDSIA